MDLASHELVEYLKTAIFIGYWWSIIGFWGCTIPREDKTHIDPSKLLSINPRIPYHTLRLFQQTTLLQASKVKLDLPRKWRENFPWFRIWRQDDLSCEYCYFHAFHDDQESSLFIREWSKLDASPIWFLIRHDVLRYTHIDGDTLWPGWNLVGIPSLPSCRSRGYRARTRHLVVKDLLIQFGGDMDLKQCNQ